MPSGSALIWLPQNCHPPLGRTIWDERRGNARGGPPPTRRLPWARRLIHLDRTGRRGTSPPDQSVTVLYAAAPAARPARLRATRVPSPRRQPRGGVPRRCAVIGGGYVRGAALWSGPPSGASAPTGAAEGAARARPRRTAAGGHEKRQERPRSVCCERAAHAPATWKSGAALLSTTPVPLALWRLASTLAAMGRAASASPAAAAATIAAVAGAVLIHLAPPAAAATPPTCGVRCEGPAAVSIAVTADIPYGLDRFAGLPSLVADVNAAGARIRAMVNLGDVKDGNDPCSDEYFVAIKETFFDNFTAPLIFTPGDNDWTGA